MSRDYYIISESNSHITALFKDKRGKWVYSTSYMNAYQKGHRKELTEEEAQTMIKEESLNEM